MLLCKHSSFFVPKKLIKLWLYELLIVSRCKCVNFYKINTNKLSCDKLVNILNILDVVSVHNIYQNIELVNARFTTDCSIESYHIINMTSNYIKFTERTCSL